MTSCFGHLLHRFPVTDDITHIKYPMQFMAYDNTSAVATAFGWQILTVIEHTQHNSTFRGDVPPLNYNEFEQLALVTVTFECIEWE